MAALTTCLSVLIFVNVVLLNFGCTTGQTESYQNRTLVVTSILSEPWLVLKQQGPESLPLVGNDRYEGYIADMLLMLANTAGFQYVIQPVRDGRYGSMTKTGEWTGMIGELINAQADIAAAPLTMTSMRARVIDFTHPFHKLGLTMLVKKPSEQPEPTLIISFHSAFTWSTWSLVGSCALLTCVLLRIVSLFHPCEWTRLHEAGGDVEYERESMNITGVVWFVLAALMGQGSPVSPRSIGGRCLAGTWYIFSVFVALLFASSIVAQIFALYANDTYNQRKDHQLRSFDDLADLADDYKIGLVGSGSTEHYFRTSTMPTEERIYKAIFEHPENVANNNQEGVQRVLDEDNYVMIMESTSAHYISSTYCNLTTIDEMSTRAYGLALRLSQDELLEALNRAILELNEDAELEKLYRKWMKGKDACWREHALHHEHHYADMSFKDVDALGFGVHEAAYAFFVLLFAVLLSILLCIIEVLVLPRFKNSE